VNEYFINNPANILGQLDFGTGSTYGRPSMIVHRPDDLAERLADLPKRVPADGYQPIRRGSEPRFKTNNTKDRQQSITTDENGDLYLVQGERLVKLEDVLDYRVKDAKKTEQRRQQLSDMVGLRRGYGALIDAERDGAENVEALRKDLRQKYEAFRKAHGQIIDSDGLAIMRRVGDPSHSMLAALETSDGKPSRILTESTVRSKKKLDQPTVRDAFVVQRNESMHVDLARVAEMSGSTPEVAAKELVDSGAVFRTPGGGYEVADVFLSGNVRRKLREALEAKSHGEEGLDSTIAALQEAVPPTIPYFKIEAKLGAPWVANEDYTKFIQEMLGVDTPKGINVNFVASRWKVRLEGDLNHRPEATTTWGHPDARFDRMLSMAMGNQSITIRKRDTDGKSYVDELSTREANDKISKIREHFPGWLWQDAERKVRLEGAYNDVMNAIATPRFDGGFLEFPGMALRRGNDPFSLRSHQANAIWRGLVNRAGLYAHEVGTGKTYTMGGIAVESRRYGIAKKPLIMAHNANSATVAAEIVEMYPGANVLYVDNLTPDQIDTTMRRMANDDWDAIVVPHSLIDRFAMSEETLNDMMAEDIAALEEEAMSAASEDGASISVAEMDDEDAVKKLRSPTAKQLVHQRNKIKEQIKKAAERASREDAVKFEDLGIDMILVDEVHEFKKPPISTKMKMRGLNTGTSDRSIALRFLTDYVKKLNDGRGVHIFTGTPITNTLAEIYNMQRYVMDDVMRA
jgi:N12 class adenine-specific DNA methylase